MKRKEPYASQEEFNFRVDHYPSPLMTITFNLGLNIFAPVAKAMALPCGVWRVSPLKLGLGIQPA
ncbi:unnamed protein product, partial [marine sediment metagenome]